MLSSISGSSSGNIFLNAALWPSADERLSKTMLQTFFFIHKYIVCILDHIDFTGISARLQIPACGFPQRYRYQMQYMPEFKILISHKCDALPIMPFWCWFSGSQNAL